MSLYFPFFFPLVLFSPRTTSRSCSTSVIRSFKRSCDPGSDSGPVDISQRTLVNAHAFMVRDFGLELCDEIVVLLVKELVSAEAVHETTNLDNGIHALHAFYF
jgi:hypothetical protein